LYAGQSRNALFGCPHEAWCEFFLDAGGRYVRVSEFSRRD
jgi:hypothetical protein